MLVDWSILKMEAFGVKYIQLSKVRTFSVGVESNRGATDVGVGVVKSVNATPSSHHFQGEKQHCWK